MDMKVSELAKRAGIAPSAIRFYEAEGILPTAARGATGYRNDDEDDLCRVRVLVSLRALGLDLREAGRLADQCSTGRCDLMAENLLPRSWHAAPRSRWPAPSLITSTPGWLNSKARCEVVEPNSDWKVKG